MKIVLTCEHGGNNIPNSLQYLFDDAQEVLETHRGYDLGALDIYDNLKELSDYHHACTTSRLLIELNRSMHHPQLFSEFTKHLPSPEKKSIIETYYIPYREKIERWISKLISQGDNVLHISVHSFTPVLNDHERRTDIGILYDPARLVEKNTSSDLRKKIMEQIPDLKVRYNYPYLGKSDGFTTSLRRKFGHNYAGIELEVNQKFSTANKMDEDVKKIIYRSISDLKKTSLS